MGRDLNFNIAAGAPGEKLRGGLFLSRWLVFVVALAAVAVFVMMMPVMRGSRV